MLWVRGLESVPPVDLAWRGHHKKEADGDIGEVDSDDSGSYPVDNVTAYSVILIEQHPLVTVVILGWPIVLNTENTWNIESLYGRLDAGLTTPSMGRALSRYVPTCNCPPSTCVTSADHDLPGSNFLHSSALPFAATSTMHEVGRAILIRVVT